MSSKIVASALLGVVLLGAGVARAQASASDAAIAQSLFDEGRKLMNEKKFPEACPRLERSYKLDPAAGTLLNLAVCHEALGKTATAWNEFRDSVALARRENRSDRLTFAQKHIRALQGRICTVTVNDATREPGLEWKIDGIKFGTESLGIALPIDPGKHTLEADAPGKLPWTQALVLERDGETETVDIPALAAAPPPQKLEPLPVVVVQKPRGSGVSGWVFVTGSIAVLGFGALGLGGGEAISNWNDRKAACGVGGDPNACSQAGVDADNAARTWALVADIGLGVGVAATIVTIVVAAVGHGKPKEAHVAFSPFASPSGAGLSLGGAF